MDAAFRDAHEKTRPAVRSMIERLIDGSLATATGNGKAAGQGTAMSDADLDEYRHQLRTYEGQLARLTTHMEEWTHRNQSFPVAFGMQMMRIAVTYFRAELTGLDDEATERATAAERDRCCRCGRLATHWDKQHRVRYCEDHRRMSDVVKVPADEF